MCGIAGIVSPGDPAKSADAVARMTDALARRGPDGCGIHRWPAAVLGHRRLAIFDLSAAGDQPMLSRDGQVGIVFNGAIYNFLELRSQLEERGHAFTSRTDTEVLVEGYIEWGMGGLLERIRGMFAFALWDERAGKLWLVRDRLGVKPLVYAERDGAVAFASTIRALRAAGYGDDLEPGAVLEYLRFGFVPDEESIYGGIRKVPAATVIEWSEGRAQERTYWSPPAAGTTPIRFEEAVERTEALLLDAVQTRLQADVPVGALLSGGIDSSLVCWAIAKLGGDITAFTIGTPGDPWDEAEEARQTARRIGIKHQVLDMTDSEPPDLDELLSAYSEPFACASALGMLRVSRAVKPSAKVLLTGDGGDDVFLGYPRHRHLALAGRLAGVLPSAVEKAWLSVQDRVPRPGPLRRAAALLDYTAGGLDEFLDKAEALPEEAAGSLLGPRLREAPPVKRRVPRGVPARRALAEYLDYERRTQFVAEYMTKVDGATMYYGLEARSPFLDQKLWEFASSLPLDLRLHRYRLKAVLRELARKRIGPEVARRRKKGFGVPVHRWVKGRWRDRVHASLRDSHLVRGGWVRPESLRSVLRGQPGAAGDSGLGWRLFVLESWLAREAETGSGGEILREPGSAAVSGGRA